MNKTILLFALPGTGKTTIVKTINDNLLPVDRLAVDFDYTAPRAARFNAAWTKIRKAQTDIINAYHELGVKLITTFPDAVLIKNIDRSKIQVIWLLPQDNPIYLVERCEQRSLSSLGHLTTFDIEYRHHCLEWVQRWWNYFQTAKHEEDMLIAFNASTINFVPAQILSLVIRGDKYGW